LTIIEALRYPSGIPACANGDELKETLRRQGASIAEPFRQAAKPRDMDKAIEQCIARKMEGKSAY